MASQQWELPPIEEIFDAPARTAGAAQIRHHIQGIKKVLLNFELDARISDVHIGPRMSQISLELAPSLTLARLKRLEPDLAVALSGRLIEMTEPQPGSSQVHLLLENRRRSRVRLRQILKSERFDTSEGRLEVGLGLTPAGQPVIIDLAELPHLLIGGTSRSGKSTCLNSLVACLLSTHTPDTLQLLLIDSTGVELQSYNGLPHLTTPVVTQTAQTLDTLEKVVATIEQRYQTLAQAQVRDIATYNQQNNSPKMPYLVVVIDNLFDLMIDAPKELEQILRQISQKARAAGVHLILATFNTKTDALAGAIKANFPGRIAFRTASSAESRQLLDVNGAEKLLGEGDMFYKAPNQRFLQRIQSTYVSEQEIRRLVRYWRQA